ncbi:MAG: serine hydrolase [Alphaproteobacteria bacterium]|nr:serine hydrolase [Alphaproteobacteria bacterium]
MDISRRTLIGGAAVLAGAAASAKTVTHKTGGGGAESKMLGALADYVDQHRADWGLPGMTVCVVDRDGFAGYVTSGWANVDRRVKVGPDHLFQIGSISKMMGALAIWTLIDEGALSPDARVKTLLPELPLNGGDDVVLQHLLNHTSGLPDYPPLFPEGGLWTGYAAGSHWSYSNTGYLIAGLIGARAAKRFFTDLLAERVLTPLSMTQSVAGMREEDRERYAQGYEYAFQDRPPFRPGPMRAAPWVDSDDPAGCVAATGRDMGYFLKFLIRLCEGKGAPILSDAAAQRFLADPADAPGWADGVQYGNGIARIVVDGRRYLHHTGGMVSFSSSLHVDMEAGVAAFASSNVHNGLGYRPRDVTQYACALMRGLREKTAAPSPKPTRPIVDRPTRYVGVFTAADGDSFEIVARADRIVMRRRGGESDMQPAGEDFFACREADFAVTGIKFDLENESARRAWAGETEYAADPAAGYRPPAPAAMKALAGRYDTDDPWRGLFYVYARDGKLWLNNTDELVPLGNGEWRVGEKEWSPERIRFDGFIDGRPLRVMFSGAPYMRRFS